MSIPRAKVFSHYSDELYTRTRLFWGWTCDTCGGTDWGYSTPRDAADVVLGDHLEPVHGVRTVGSLTADDIGKWIEVGHVDLVTGTGWSEMDGFRGQIVGIEHWDKRTKVRCENDRLHAPSCTPCRVTEAKP